MEGLHFTIGFVAGMAFFSLMSMHLKKKMVREIQDDINTFTVTPENSDNETEELVSDSESENEEVKGWWMFN